MDIVTDLATLSGVPGLGLIMGSANAMVASMDDMRVHREQCHNLLGNALKLLVSLREQDPDVSSTPVRDAISAIENILHAVCGKMKDWSKMNRVRMFLNQDDVKRDLEKYHSELEMAFRRFTMTTNLVIVRNQEIQKQMAEMAQSFSESQARDTANLREVLTAIVGEDLHVVAELKEPAVRTIMNSLQEASVELRRNSNTKGPSTADRAVFKLGLTEIKRRTGYLPPATDLTGEVTRLGDAPFEVGATSDIWLGEWLGEKVALKALRNIGQMNERTERNFQREVSIWRELNHKHVLRLYGICYIAPFTHIVSPYAANRNVLYYLKNNPSADRVRLLSHAASGLMYLHTRSTPVIHGDLRAANILVSEGGDAFISDFGLARLEQVSESSTNSSVMQGACRWMAPELITPELVYRSTPTPTTQTDTWSFGMVALELFTGKRPYDHRTNEAQVMQDIMREFRHPRPQSCADLTDELWGLITQCWKQNCNERPRMQEVVRVLTTIRDGTLPRQRTWSTVSTATSAGSSSQQNPYPERLPRIHESPKPLPRVIEEEQHPLDNPEWMSLLSGFKTSPEIDYLDQTLAQNLNLSKQPYSIAGRDTSRGTREISSQSSSSSHHSLGTHSDGPSSVNSGTIPITPHSGRFPGVMSSQQSQDAGPRLDNTRTDSLQQRTYTPPEPRPRIIRPLPIPPSNPSISTTTIQTAPVDQQEVILSSDGRSVEAGSLEGLVDYLVTTAAMQKDFADTFFVVYRSFTTPDGLLDVLMDEYQAATRMNISVEDSVRIRYNVWKVIECWLQSHPMERTDKNLLTRMREFARSIIDQTTISRKANTVIYELVKPVLEGSAVPQPSRSSTGSGASVFSVDTVVLNDLTNDDIAKHLTLMEYRLFTAVGVIDCVAALERWTDSKFSAANTFIQRNQQIAAWVQKLVLKAPQPKDRASIIQRFVLVAHRCRQLGNYSSMSAIVLALQSVVISRLQRTMQLINEPTRRQLSDMGRLLDHNYRSYRELLKGYYGPMIPILRILMHDIQLDNGKIPKTMQGTSSRLIHFDKYNKLVKAIRKALVHQKSVYQLNENPAHMRCIDRQVRSMSLGEELDAKLEKMSTDHRKAEQQNFITRKVEREILGLR